MLLSRLTAFCQRLAREITQESVCLAPQLACAWVAGQGKDAWLVPCDLNANANVSIALGLCGWHGGLVLCGSSPGSIDRRSNGQEGRGISDQAVRDRSAGRRSKIMPWLHTARRRGGIGGVSSPCLARESHYGALVLGPTLVYGKDKTPVAGRPDEEIAARMRRALSVIASAWPEGDRLLALLTSRVVPLKASGVVSFSYRHRPGLSAINCFDRDRLDLIDDLIHETATITSICCAKTRCINKITTRRFFYSPWRRSLRPLRGFFTRPSRSPWGRCCSRLSTWASGRAGTARWKRAGLSPRDLERPAIAVSKKSIRCGNR
ncbi:MAG: hypothetical protein IPM88_17855 [Nitrospira sp.]|nr:hypothetical protein [Nitrospira sp.]